MRKTRLGVIASSRRDSEPPEITVTKLYIINSGRTASDEGFLITAVEDMVTAGIYDKVISWHLLNGGDETKNELNIVDPYDLDSAQRLIFTGCNHDANGVSIDSGGNFDSKLIWHNIMGSPDWGITVYEQNLVPDQMTAGNKASGFGYFSTFTFETSTSKTYPQFGNVTSAGAVVTGGNKRANHTFQRDGNNLEAYFNGTNVATEVLAPVSLVDDGTGVRRRSFNASLTPASTFLIHQALTAGEIASLHTILTTLMTNLGINVTP